MVVRVRAPVRVVLPLCATVFAVVLVVAGGEGAISRSAEQDRFGRVNHAPVIAATDAIEIAVGAAYAFEPRAVDADGDALRFTAVNLPPWAQIDSATGRVTGTPDDDDVGEYESIAITVADATRTAVTLPFSIVVVGSDAPTAPEAPTAPLSSVASIDWETPLSKADGSPLDDLAGFRILYGRNADDLDESVLVMNPSARTYDFPELGTGIWYFSVVAVNAGGLESPPTTPAMKSI